MNATTGIKVFINGKDYSDYLVDGSISDESAYSSNIIKTTGTIKLAGSNVVLDFNKKKFPIGSSVTFYASLSNGKYGKLPRNTLLVLSSSIDLQEPSITLELGCSLSFISEREASYESEIEQLIVTFIPAKIKRSFVLEQKNLSTLNSMLDIAGKVIFQNKDGSIQSVTKFGKGGLGANPDKAKLVSFDKFTTIDVQSIGDAIEDIPSAIIAKATTEIIEGADDDDDDTEDGKPPPFSITSISRTIKVPKIKLIKIEGDGQPPAFRVENKQDQPEAGEEAVPHCGTPADPGAKADTSPYGYTLIGDAEVGEEEVQDTVYRASFTSYEGPGNQVDYEYDWEYGSGATYANSFLSAYANLVVKHIKEEAEKSKGFCGKLNQAYTTRDDFASRPKTVDYFYNVDAETGERTLIATRPSEESKANENAQKYYACAAEQYKKAADFHAQGANNLAKGTAAKNLDLYLGKSGYSSLNITYYRYGSGDELIQKITKNYIHSASADLSVNAVENIPYNTYDGGFLLRVGYASGSLDLSAQSYYVKLNLVSKTFEQTLQGDVLYTFHNTAVFKYPSSFNLFEASRTTVTYTYKPLYTREVVEYEDFQDPINNYIQINHSSSGSKNPAEPDRIEVKRDADGNIYSSNVNTKTEELEYKQNIKLKGDPVDVKSLWLGNPESSPKEINLPLDFAPIVQKYDSGGTKLPFNPQGVLNEYTEILQKYSKNEARKIAADNAGFRITEIGTRAELFGYYPYYPIALNLSSLGKRYGLKSSSSSWVFDKDNVLCSIDCFRNSEIVTSIDQDEISPYIYPKFIKTEVAVTLDAAFFNLPAHTASIVLLSLPQTGSLTVNGTAASIGTTITVAQITSNLVVYTPAGAGTTQVSITYKALDSNGDEIGSGDKIYPKDDDQYDFPQITFADAGEFTNNTTNGGYPSDAGNFNTNLRPGGNYFLDGGDFDTGEEVEPVEPAPSNPSGNGEDDPEDDYGTEVEDEDGNLIGTDELPGPDGDDEGILEIDLTLNYKTFGFLKITSQIILQLGWDYGYVTLEKGTSIDNGTIVSPSNYNLDFGTIAAPIEPVLASSVN